MRMHRSSVELLDQLYGLAGRDGHLEGCAECGKRLEEMNAARRRSAGEARAALPADFLAAQRARIWQRVEEGPWRRMLVKPLPAAAAAAVILAGFLLWSPGKPAPYPDDQLLADVAAAVAPPLPHLLAPRPEQASARLAQSASDARLFEEIQKDLSANEPRAAAPLRGLYSEAY